MSIYFAFFLAFLTRTSLDIGRVIITLYALKLGAQPFTVGVLAAILSVVPTLFSWQVGRFADRFGSRWPLMLCTVAGSLGMLVPYVIPRLPSLFVTAMMFGLLATLSATPMQNLVGLLSKPQDRAKNYSNFSLVVASATFAGPLMAGFTFDHAGPDMACLSLVLLLLVPAVMLVVWGGIIPGGTRNTKSTGSVRTLLSESGLWRVLITSGLVVMCIDMFLVYIPIYGHGIGLSASAIGILLATFSLAAFVARFFMPFLIERFTAERLLAYSFLIGAAGFILVPLFKLESIVILSMVSFLFGLGMGFGQPITLMMTFSGSTQGRSGEAIGLRFTANNLMRAVGQILLGSISAAFGVFSVFWINALILASGWAFSHPRAFGRSQKRS
jgi:MFS family permease